MSLVSFSTRPWLATRRYKVSWCKQIILPSEREVGPLGELILQDANESCVKHVLILLLAMDDGLGVGGGYVKYATAEYKPKMMETVKNMLQQRPIHAVVLLAMVASVRYSPAQKNRKQTNWMMQRCFLFRFIHTRDERSRVFCLWAPWWSAALAMSFVVVFIHSVH